jgi:transposase
MDLRQRVVAALERGDPIAVVAGRFSISRTAARDWRTRASERRLAPGKPGPTGPRVLTEADDALMRQQVAARPGITAKELMPLLSVEVVESTVCRRLRKLGLRLKKGR